jgi:hypothetical protein
LKLNNTLRLLAGARLPSPRVRTHFLYALPAFSLWRTVKVQTLEVPLLTAAFCAQSSLRLNSYSHHG